MPFCQLFCQQDSGTSHSANFFGTTYQPNTGAPHSVSFGRHTSERVEHIILPILDHVPALLWDTKFCLFGWRISERVEHPILPILGRHSSGRLENPILSALADTFLPILDDIPVKYPDTRFCMFIIDRVGHLILLTYHTGTPNSARISERVSHPILAALTTYHHQ
ncbi:hypothetical protein BaRGS_00015943 [Batillaria attramentaria]|uniref:Uncharacterized protein n=1 Tax=Batillaria attramentaria TaxID=370345 RepID=A0ABD0L107_9CAEN